MAVVPVLIKRPFLTSTGKNEPDATPTKDTAVPASDGAIAMSPPLPTYKALKLTTALSLGVILTKLLADEKTFVPIGTSL